MTGALRIAASVLCLFGAGAAAANTSPSATAQAAADQLRAASAQLEQSKSARDRVKALTATVRAFETGLTAMREGLRQAANREDILAQQLAARDGDVADLIAILMSLSRASSPVRLSHPGGPLGSARAGMLVSELTPAVTSRANALRRDLNEIATLKALQETASTDLTQALTDVQEARTALSQAMADRTDLPRKFVEDPIRTAILTSNTQTLEAFASGLRQIAQSEAMAPLPDISELKGKLPLPAQGRILRQAGQADAAGIVRPGVLLATRPSAMVTTPSTATIRYHGDLLDLGNVVILEPQSDLLIVLAGLDQLFGEIGQVLPKGFPVGLMGGQGQLFNQNPSQQGEGAGNNQSETLYIEVREDNKPVDPLVWFASTKD